MSHHPNPGARATHIVPARHCNRHLLPSSNRLCRPSPNPHDKTTCKYPLCWVPSALATPSSNRSEHCIVSEQCIVSANSATFSLGCTIEQFVGRVWVQLL